MPCRGRGSECLRGQLCVGRASEGTVGTLIPHNILLFQSRSYRLDEIYLNLEERNKRTSGNTGTQKARVTALDSRPQPPLPGGGTARGCCPRGGSTRTPHEHVRPHGRLTSLAQLSHFSVLQEPIAQNQMGTAS